MQPKLIHQIADQVSSLVDQGLNPYLVTTLFHEKEHIPTDTESDLMCRIGQAKKAGASADVMVGLYGDLSRVRTGINLAINQNLYRKSVDQNRLAFIWKHYDRWMNHLAGEMMNHHRRPPKLRLHPISFDFVDIMGSRENNHIHHGDETEHVHSIYLIHDDVHDRFQELINQDFMPVLAHAKLTGIAVVGAKPIERSMADYRQVTSYSSKFYCHPVGRTAHDQGDLYQQYANGCRTGT